MSTYDAENLLEAILGVMTSGLNAKVAAIEAEKLADGKGLTPALAAINSAAYYAQTWDEKILNSKGASIFYGIGDVSLVENAGAHAKTYKMFVDVVYVDSDLQKDGYKRILRYSRALEELFAVQFAPAIAGGTVKVEQIYPIGFKLEMDSSDEVKIGGVSLTVTLV